MKSARYVEILEQNLWSVVAKYCSMKPWSFHDYICAVHNSRFMMQWKRLNDIPCLVRPLLTKLRYQRSRRCLVNAKNKAEQKSEGLHSREALIRVVKEVWAVVWWYLDGTGGGLGGGLVV